MSTVSTILDDREGGRWIARHRWKAALAVAAAEGLLAVWQGASRWALIAVALVVLFAYFRWGRGAKSTAGELVWIGAASQVLVILLTITAFFLGVLVLAAVAGLAAIALLLLLLGRG